MEDESKIVPYTDEQQSAIDSISTPKREAAKPVRKPRAIIKQQELPTPMVDSEYIEEITESTAGKQDAYLEGIGERLPDTKPVLTFHWIAGFFPVDFSNKHGAWGADMCAVHAPLDMGIDFYKGIFPPVRTATEQVFNNWFTDGLVDVQFEDGLPVRVETKDAIFIRRK